MNEKLLKIMSCFHIFPCVRTLDHKTKKHHIPLVDRTPDEPPPVVVGIVGPPKVGKSTLMQCLVKNYAKQKLSQISGPVTVVSGESSVAYNIAMVIGFFVVVLPCTQAYSFWWQPVHCRVCTRQSRDRYCDQQSMPSGYEDTLLPKSTGLTTGLLSALMTGIACWGPIPTGNPHTVLLQMICWSFCSCCLFTMLRHYAHFQIWISVHLHILYPVLYFIFST